MKKIKLTQGQIALVDDEDFEELNKHKWFAHKHKRGKTYYARRVTGGRKNTKTLSMHRVIMDAPGNLLVDHRNGNGLDNQKNNMRLCTNAENCRNQVKSTKKKYSSQYKGVSYFKPSRRWKAEIIYNKDSIHLGYHLTEEGAALAYDSKAKELYGEFANLNLKDNTDG